MTINIAAALRLYFIAGTQDMVGRSLPETLQDALTAGITCFQFREKGPNSLEKNRKEMKEMAKTCLALCQAARVPFVMNDDVEMALEIGADGVHVGQNDRNIHETIQLVKGNLFIGLSVNTFEQFKEAESVEKLDYVGIGPVYETLSKTDAQATVGLELLEKIASQPSHLPIVAIGGISERTAHLVRATGVAGISVISEISRSKEIKRTVKGLNKKI